MSGFGCDDQKTDGRCNRNADSDHPLFDSSCVAAYCEQCQFNQADGHVLVPHEFDCLAKQCVRSHLSLSRKARILTSLRRVLLDRSVIFILGSLFGLCLTTSAVVDAVNALGALKVVCQ